MKQSVFIIESNERIAKNTFEMRLDGDASAFTRAGQFADFALEGKFLRRPISVCDWNEEGFSIIYKTVGNGTAQMSSLERGDMIDALTGLGNGFNTDKIPDGATLVGGGAGLAPLYALARILAEDGKNVKVVAGFNAADEVYYADEFRALCADVAVVTANGETGYKGYATDYVSAGAYVCACGPESMLRAAHLKSADGQFSFEARMACGFGACMGCTCKTKFGAKRVCADGPVFFREEILW